MKALILAVVIFIVLTGCDGGNEIEQRAQVSPSTTPSASHSVSPSDSSAVSPVQENSQTGEKISTFMTEMLDKEDDRVNNVLLASSSIDNLVLQPGDEFSFNQVVGPRTEERGYKEAFILVGTERETGVGGGICQVSSTLYQAALAANLEITERHPHAKKVPYVDEGDDATIAGDIDLKFVNTYDRPIRIDVIANEGAVTVDIYKE